MSDLPCLYHFTCEHGRSALGDAGALIPACELTGKWMPWPGRYVWLTDLVVPMRGALGLTQRITLCDRTAHRYRVTDTTGVVPWHVAARGEPRRWELEDNPDTRPMHWFVSLAHVPVEYDPLQPHGGAHWPHKVAR